MSDRLRAFLLGRHHLPYLPRLLDILLADLGERFGIREPSLAPRARAWMLEYAWPGNLRQLENVMQQAVLAVEKSDKQHRRESHADIEQHGVSARDEEVERPRELGGLPARR